MIVALARKLLIALWRMVTIGQLPEGVALPAAYNRQEKLWSFGSP
jgi:transposase